MKQRTRFTIIFGGIAGGLPAVAGRTAVTGTIDLTSLLIGLFVLYWIPLHILTLALIPKNLEGYRNANIPIWPLAFSNPQTIQVIIISTLLSSLTIVITGMTLKINIIAMIPLIAFDLFISYQSAINLKDPSSERTFKIFKLASTYMAFALLCLFTGVVLSNLPI